MIYGYMDMYVYCVYIFMYICIYIYINWQIRFRTSEHDNIKLAMKPQK